MSTVRVTRECPACDGSGVVPFVECLSCFRWTSGAYNDYCSADVCPFGHDTGCQDCAKCKGSGELVHELDDVETHSDGCHVQPAINVKAHHFPSAWDVAEWFDCSDDVAQQAAQYAWDMSVQDFWEQAGEIASDVLGRKIWQAGQSGGWLVADLGLEWDDETAQAWGVFAERIATLLAWVQSEEYVRDNIAANRWAEPGAQAYNFVDFGNGQTACAVDLARVASEAQAEYIAGL